MRKQRITAKVYIMYTNAEKYGKIEYILYVIGIGD